jgi:DNA-binding transcriptional LysR family regulator
MMSPQRLRLLVELARLDTMTAVGAATGYSTSGVSHQLAALEREVGAQLVERQGRGVRLTPAGRRLAEHAVGILAAMEEAEADLLQTGQPTGTVRLTGFTSAIVFVVVPVVEQLARTHPAVAVLIDEGEPDEALDKLHSGHADVVVLYDYTLNPHTFPATSVLALGREPVDLVVPHHLAGSFGAPAGQVRAVDLAKLGETGWISNSRSHEDDELISRLCGLAQVTATVSHRVDSTGLIIRLVADGLGVALMPRLARPQPPTPEVSYLEVVDPPVRRRFFALSRAGGGSWPPVALLLSELGKQCQVLGLTADERPGRIGRG